MRIILGNVLSYSELSQSKSRIEKLLRRKTLAALNGISPPSIPPMPMQDYQPVSESMSNLVEVSESESVAPSMIQNVAGI